MAEIDKELSLIDHIRYAQAKRPEHMPPFLDVHLEGSFYRYNILFANLGEHHESTRMPQGAEHAHAVFHLVLYVAGRGHVVINDRIHPVKSGDLVVIEPGTMHAFNPAGGAVVYHALTFALLDGDRSIAMRMDELLTYYSGQPVSLSALTHPDTATFMALRRRIEATVSALQHQPVDWLQHQQHMIAIFSLLSDFGTQIAPPVGFVQQARLILDARFADPALTLQTLAAELHTSTEHLCRQFRRETGSSPIHYRNQLRMQAARAFLRNTNLPCKAIASRLGYGDLYTFSKAYRRATGHAPSHERKARG